MSEIDFYQLVEKLELTWLKQVELDTGFLIFNRLVILTKTENRVKVNKYLSFQKKKGTLG